MLLGKVIGTVTASRKDPKMEGMIFQVLQVMDIKGKLSKTYVVAVDAVGAGLGEVVMYASGSSARQTVNTNNKPCDAVIMAIVDSWDLEGTTLYKKDED